MHLLKTNFDCGENVYVMLKASLNGIQCALHTRPILDLIGYSKLTTLHVLILRDAAIYTFLGGILDMCSIIMHLLTWSIIINNYHRCTSGVKPGVYTK